MCEYPQVGGHRRNFPAHSNQLPVVLAELAQTPRQPSEQQKGRARRIRTRAAVQPAPVIGGEMPSTPTERKWECVPVCVVESSQRGRRSRSSATWRRTSVLYSLMDSCFGSVTDGIAPAGRRNGCEEPRTGLPPPSLRFLPTNSKPRSRHSRTGTLLAKSAGSLLPHNVASIIAPQTAAMGVGNGRTGEAAIERRLKRAEFPGASVVFRSAPSAATSRQPKG